MQRLKLIFNFVNNMGLRYILFRIWHMVQVKTGFFKKKFPTNPNFKTWITLAQWKELKIPFFIDDKSSIEIPKKLNRELELRFRESVKNNITFFNSQQFQLDAQIQWEINPTNGYRYDANQHWSQIADLSKTAGDIKYVWEKARFSYLYDVIRYDYHSGQDQSHYVMSEIEDFINKNPINQGPQYKCSQEISLRVLNWTYALNYYKHSEALTDQLFNKIINSIYWQLDHVRKNINFSRIAVRNNHAITETLTLYLSHLLFPFIPETKEWSKKGKKWFEQEIDYQVYNDGTFLQYSMNYHRVVVQLLTWALRLNDINGLRFRENVITKAKKSLEYLYNCMDLKTGKLPNYGSNDGALFFKFTDDDYRVYRSQLDDLRMVLYGEATAHSESFAWYGMKNPVIKNQSQKEIAAYGDGGYYIVNELNTKTFIKCGHYKDRPAQADNLHVDIWINGVNYLWDNGSYKYNTDDEYLNHFMGTAGHNTVSIDGSSQMLKGGRFIWYYWVKKATASLLKKQDEFIFKGEIKAFKHLGGITHNRVVIKAENETQWQVEDSVSGKGNKLMEQNWHINPQVYDKINFVATDENGNQLKATVRESWYSEYYGVKEKSKAITFATSTNKINTHITIKVL